jgi:hypothetical protein
MFYKKAIRLILTFSCLLFIIHFNCKKTPTSPDLDEVTKPKIWLNVSEISFTATEAGANPNSQTLQVRNSGGGTLNYSMSYDAAWLNVSPTSGSSTNNVNEHTVSVNIISLREGDYSGKIKIASSNATNSPQTVSVILRIGSPLTDNEISISCDPGSGGIGTMVTVPVAIKGNIKEVKAFGLELVYDPSMFAYQGVSKGDKTGNWAAVDGNEVISGRVRVGGFAGGADSIPKGSIGSIAKITLKVIYSGDDVKQSEISIRNYTDDILGMKPEPSSTTFTYKK